MYSICLGKNFDKKNWQEKTANRIQCNNTN